MATNDKMGNMMFEDARSMEVCAATLLRRGGYKQRQKSVICELWRTSNREEKRKRYKVSMVLVI